MSQSRTRDTFGYKWGRHPVAPPDYNGSEEVRPTMKHSHPTNRVKRNGWEVADFEDWIDGKQVLDAGCGVGWWLNYLDDVNPSGFVCGVDIAREAIQKAHEFENGCSLVGDIGSLPFRSETFDYISCEEVIHHTPDPPAYLKALTEVLSPGGTITLYIYKTKPLLREMADTVLREVTTEMDVEECLDFCEDVTRLGEALYDIEETIQVPDVPLLDIEGGEYTVHEFVYRYFVKCFFDWDHESYENSLVTNFDWYHPEYAFRYSPSEICDIVEGANLTIEYLNEQMSGVSVRASKQ